MQLCSHPSYHPTLLLVGRILLSLRVPRRGHPQDHGNRGYRGLFRQARHADAGGVGLRRDSFRSRRSHPARSSAGRRAMPRWLLAALHPDRHCARASLLASRCRAIRQPDEPLPEEPRHHRRHAVPRRLRPGRSRSISVDGTTRCPTDRRTWSGRTSIRCGTATSASRRSRRRPKDAPMHWRWRDIEPFTERAAKEVGDRGRRAPRADPRQPGVRRRDRHHAEPDRRLHRARARRQGACRTGTPPRRSAFATRAEGAVTIVNGRRCEMKEGDLVLTPPMCWHGHINEGDRRTVWFDAANMPAICALDASFFEPGYAAGRALLGSRRRRLRPNTAFPATRRAAALAAQPTRQGRRAHVPLHDGTAAR